MSTLADKLFLARPTGDDVVDKIVGTAIRCLKRPWEGNHVVPAHVSISSMIAVEAEDIADIFVFDDTVVNSALSIIENDNSVAIARQYACHRYAPRPHRFQYDEILIRIIANIGEIKGYRDKNAQALDEAEVVELHRAEWPTITSSNYCGDYRPIHDYFKRLT